MPPKTSGGSTKFLGGRKVIHGTAQTRVVQYTRTVTVRINYVSIRTDRTDRQQGFTVCKVCYTVCKECFTVRKSHLISGTFFDLKRASFGF